MPDSFYEILWIFFIYAVIGWCIEVAFVAVNRGVFVNRGFMNGPYCPIYGLGMLIVVTVLNPVKDSLLFLFLGSFILTTVLEYITGLILEKIFGNKWWNYSEMPFNIHGYVCLAFSILWGLGGVFVMRLVHPIIYRIVLWIPETIGCIFITIFMIGFVVDLCVTVNTVLHFNKDLRLLDKIAENIHKLSDELGENLFEKVSSVTNEEKIAELKKLQEEYKQILEQKNFGFKRLVKAFPNLKTNKGKSLQQYKNILRRKQE